MKKLWDLKKGFSNLELEGQRHGIIMGVTRLLLLGQFYTIQTQTDQTFWRGVYKDKLIRTLEPFDIQSSNLRFWGWHENFFSQMRNLEVEIPIWIFFFEKTAFFLFSFFEVGDWIFFDPMLSRKTFATNSLVQNFM